MMRSKVGFLMLGMGLGVWATACEPRTRTFDCTLDADCPAGQGCVGGACVAVACRVAADCPAGQSCLDHRCILAPACTLDADCPAGEVCEDRACRPGCRTDVECAPRTCDPGTRTCLGCLGKDECSLGELCVDGVCAPGCEGPRDCPAGLTCLPAVPPHGLCAECAVDGDCVAPERCLEHRCASPCAVDADCPAGRCDPASSTCVECLEVDDCELGELCLEGACTPGCKGSRDCPAGLTCLPDEPPHGACVECVNPEDCPELAPRACLTPLEVDFGSLPPGETATRSFAVESCGARMLTIRDYALAPGTSTDFTLVAGLSPPIELPVSSSLVLRVAYHPAAEGDDAGGVAVYTDDPASDPVSGLTGTVALRGLSDASYCDLEVVPAAIDFGVLEVGGNAEAELVLTNQGTEACVLGSVAISQNSAADEFSLVSGIAPGLGLAPAESILAALAYHPSDLGQDAGALSIRVNDKDTDEIGVELAGFARAGGDGPVAVCTVSPTQVTTPGTLTWVGDASYDPTPARTIQTWNWTVLSFPAGSAASLVGAATPNATTRTDMAGAYTVQLVVQNDLGQWSQPCSVTAEAVPAQGLSIELNWQQAGDDLDLHLLAPGGVRRTSTDCYYANCAPPMVLDWGVAGVTSDNPHLDLDDIPGTGPELINLGAPADGVYTVIVHDYPGSVFNGANRATLNIYLRGVLVDTLERDVSGEDTDWDACQIAWPAGTVTPL